MPNQNICRGAFFAYGTGLTVFLIFALGRWPVSLETFGALLGLTPFVAITGAFLAVPATLLALAVNAALSAVQARVFWWLPTAVILPITIWLNNLVFDGTELRDWAGSITFSLATGLAFWFGSVGQLRSIKLDRKQDRS